MDYRYQGETDAFFQIYLYEKYDFYHGDFSLKFCQR